MKKTSSIFTEFYNHSRRLLFAVCCALLFAVPAMAASGDRCDDDEKYPYIDQTLALCSVHAYNIGAVTNPEDAASRQAMQEVVALKTTVMTQQMKKQYDYLEVTIKRFKTQLEKAILTAKMEAAGAAPGEVDKSSAKTSGLAGTENCSWGRNTEESLSCLRRNLGEINKGIAARDFTNVSKAMKQDVQTLNGLLAAYPDCNKDDTLKNNCPDRITQDKAQPCASVINGKILCIEREAKKDLVPQYR